MNFEFEFKLVKEYNHIKAMARKASKEQLLELFDAVCDKCSASEKLNETLLRENLKFHNSEVLP